YTERAFSGGFEWRQRTGGSGRARRQHFVLLSRYDRRHERSARRKGREDRSSRHAGISRHLRSDGTNARLWSGDLRSLFREAAPVGAALSHRRDSRAHRFSRQCAEADRRRSFSPGRPPPQEKKRAIGCRLLSFFVLESGARAQDQRNFQARISTGAALAFL